MRPLLAIVFVVSVALAGCTGSAGTGGPIAGDGSSTPDAFPATGAPGMSAGRQRTLVSGLDVPWDMAALPDGSILLTLRDRAELIRVPPGEQPRVVAQLPEVVPGGEGGLLGLALSPDFASDELLYLYYTAAGDNRVVRYRYSGSGLSDATPIVTGIPKAGNHNGGRLRFGPDGRLYIGTGDAGRTELSQDRQSLGGKILRVARDGSIPADNPFGNAVYSYGHRNVQGFDWDSAGTMYASEFGQNAWDELNVIRPGANYGWPETEGATDAPGVTAPVVVWRTAEASPSGIAVSPDGQVFVAALRGERVWRVLRTSDAVARPDVFLDGLGRIRAVTVVGQELWVLTNNTARGVSRDGDDRLLAVPLS